MKDVHIITINISADETEPAGIKWKKNDGEEEVWDDETYDTLSTVDSLSDLIYEIMEPVIQQMAIQEGKWKITIEKMEVEE